MLPRSLVVLSLLFIAQTTALNDGQNIPIPKTRKTVAFGFHKPHARFVTTPHVAHPAAAKGHALFASKPIVAHDPFKVAAALIESLLPNSDEYAYRIRRDSYTDSTTGVTHVFAKQTYRGIDVADGDVNVNVKEGTVISYGNEFYHPDNHKRDQVPFVVPESQLPVNEDDPADVPSLQEVVLNFISLVTPSTELSDSIAADPQGHIDNIEIDHHHWLVDDLDNPTVSLRGVPDTVDDVKVRLVWVQTPRGLESAWKLNVEMRDNYYEATVSAVDATKVFSVVDWVSDSPLPLYFPSVDQPLPDLVSKEELDAFKKKEPKEPKEPEDPNPEPEPEPEPKPKPRPAPIPDPEDVDVDAAVYHVFPWGTNDPAEGNRSLVEHSKVVDHIASPIGWHVIPLANIPDGLDTFGFAPTPKPNKSDPILVNFTTTIGNNVFAQENFAGRNEFLNNYRPNAGSSMEFIYKFNPEARNDSNSRMKEARKHINATLAQLFYTTNAFHDLMYRYGFDEISGNFQQYNFGRGGKEDDAVIANAQDGSGFNNANFMTPPDGTNGRMRMYLWNTASPYRDGDFEAGIVIHELAHGLSTRLTGGPSDSSCLGFGESGGMGEGWGDFLATTIRSTQNYSDYPMGSWAANNVKGIRNYPYSLDKKVNPETYKAVDKYFGVHPIGEVWAEMLWVVLQRLIAKHGFTDSLFPPAPLEDGTIPKADFYREPSVVGGPLIPKHGNSLMVQLVVNGMKLQKCRPSFMDARDAIIQADQILTGGENFCELWLGFAARGLGEDARVIGRTPWGGGVRTDGFAVPFKCEA